MFVRARSGLECYTVKTDRFATCIFQFDLRHRAITRLVKKPDRFSAFTIDKRVGPLLECHHGRFQRPATFCEPINMVCAAVRKRDPLENPVRDQLIEPVRQQVFRNTCIALELAKPIGTIKCFPHNEQRPPVTKQIERGGDRAFVSMMFCHDRSVTWLTAKNNSCISIPIRLVVHKRPQELAT